MHEGYFLISYFQWCGCLCCILAVTAVSLALCHSNKANSCVAKSDGLFVVVQLKSFIFDAQTIYHSSQIGMHVACRAFRFYMNLQKSTQMCKKEERAGC